jgi:hypothetical protein
VPSLLAIGVNGSEAGCHYDAAVHCSWVARLPKRSSPQLPPATAALAEAIILQFVKPRLKARHKRLARAVRTLATSERYPDRGLVGHKIHVDRVVAAADTSGHGCQVCDVGVVNWLVPARDGSASRRQLLGVLDPRVQLGDRGALGLSLSWTSQSTPSCRSVPPTGSTCPSASSAPTATSRFTRN